MNNKLLLFMFGIILLLGIVSAELQTIETKGSVNPFGNKKIILESITNEKINKDSFMLSEKSLDLPVVRISKTFLWVETDKIAEYKIIRNDVSIVNAETYGKAVLYQDGKLFDDAEFKDLKGQLKEIVSYQYYIKQNISYVIQEPATYKTQCVKSNSTNLTKGSLLETCYEVVDTYKDVTKYKEEWVKYNYETLKSGEYEWLLKGQRKANTKFDFIPKAQGLSLDEYVWWNEEWQYKRQINLTANVGNFSYITTINYSDNMNSDFSDLRFVDCETETIEYNHTKQNYTASTNVTERIFSKGNDCVMMYYGNPTATSTSSPSNTYFNPVSYLTLDGNANDLLGVNNGTILGATYSSSGKIGGAYDFDGSNDYIELGSSANDLLFSSGEFSISGWFKADDVISRQRIIWKSTSTQAHENYAIFLQSGQLGANMNSRTGSNNDAVWYPVSAGVWYNFVFINSWDNKTFKLYVNGNFAQDYNYTGTYTPNPGGSSSIQKTQIGRISFSGGAGDYYDGLVDEVSFWNRSLTQDEITQLYTQTAPTYIVGDEQLKGGTISIDYVTPPTPENNSNLSTPYIPVEVEINYTNATLDNITYNFYKGGVLNASYFYDNETLFVNHTGCTCANWEFNVTACYTETISSTSNCVTTETREVIIDILPPTINITSPLTHYDYLTDNQTLDLNFTVEDASEHLDSCWYEYPPRFYETTTYGFSQGLRIQIDNINFSNFETLSYYYNGSIGHNNKGFKLYDNGTFDNEITLERTPNGTGIVEINLSNSYGVEYGDAYSTLTGRNLTSEGYVEIDSTNPHDIGTKKLIGDVGSSPRYFFEELTGSTANWSEAQSNTDCDFSSLNNRPTIELNTNIGNYVCVKTENRGNYRIEIISEDSWDVRKLNVISGLKRLVYSTLSVCTGGDCGWGGYEKIYGINLFANSLDCNLNTTTFQYISGINNLTLYANDTFGNVGNLTRSWWPIVTQQDIYYENETYEGENNLFQNQVLINGTLTNAYMNYAGTNYTSSIIDVGDTIILYNYLIMPDISIETNNTFYWYLLVDDIWTTSIENNQTVYPITITNCSKGTLLNLTLLDEKSQIGINGTIEVLFNIISSTNLTVETFNQSFNNTQQVNFCTSLNESEFNLFKLDGQIKYYSDNYSSELYNIQNSNLTNFPTSIYLYDILTEESTTFKITYKGDDFIIKEGVLVQLLRKYISEDSYKVVEAPITNSLGEVVLHVDLDSNIYNIIVSKDGEVLDTYENIVFICDNQLASLCTFKLDGIINPYSSIALEELRDITYSISQINDSYAMVVFSTSSGIPANVNLFVEATTITGQSNVYNNTVYSSAGSFLVPIDSNTSLGIGNNVYDFQISKDDEVIGLKQLLLNNNGIEWDNNNYFIVVLLLLSLVFMAVSSPEFVIFNAILTFVLAGGLWLVNGMNFVVGLGNLIWLVIAGGILIYKLASQEDR